MHSKIYQITEERIENDNFITERTFDDSHYDFYDYCAEITDEERSQVIDSLVKNLLPTGMFSLVTKMTNFVYNGGVDEWKENWVKQIQLKALAITPHRMLQTDWRGFTH